MKKLKKHLYASLAVLILLPQFVLANCLEDYETRRADLKHKATFGFAKSGAKAVGVTGVSTLAIGYAFYAPGPFAGISYVVGAVGAVVPAIGTVIGIETAVLINLNKTKKIIKLIEQAYDYEGKQFDRFAKRLIRKSDGRLTKQEIGDYIQTANEQGALCDASIVSPRKQRRFKKTEKLKFKLASKKEIRKYILSL